MGAGCGPGAAALPPPRRDRAGWERCAEEEPGIDDPTDPDGPVRIAGASAAKGMPRLQELLRAVQEPARGTLQVRQAERSKEGRAPRGPERQDQVGRRPQSIE